MKMQGRYLIAILSLLLIFGGLYFKFLYDVPDAEGPTNLWVSWALVVLGIIGIMASALWKARNPFETKENRRSNYKSRLGARSINDDSSERKP